MPDAMVAGVYLRVFGPAPSSILFLLPRDSAFTLVDMAMCRRERGTTEVLNAMDESALMEIGNILSGSFLNALSYFTKMTLLPSLACPGNGYGRGYSQRDTDSAGASRRLCAGY